MRSGCLLLVLFSLVLRLGAQGSRSDYERALSVEARTRDTVFRTGIRPQWLTDKSGFWYRVQTGPGTREWVFVSLPEGRREPLFDAAELARALGRELGTNLVPDTLPLEDVAVDSTNGLRTLRFRAGGSSWVTPLPKLEPKKDDRPPSELQPLQGRPTPRRSRTTGGETELTFVNRTGDDVELSWLDDQGVSRPYGRLRPGTERRQHTFAGHVWIGTDREGRTVDAFLATEEPGRAVFLGSSRPKANAERPTERREAKAPGSSPDGRWTAFITNFNLHLRGADGTSRALTTDGTVSNAYVSEVHWSPDSSHVVGRRVQAVPPHIVSWIEALPKGQTQPALRSHSYFKPGDPLPTPRIALFEARTGNRIDPDHALFANPFTEDGDIPIRWSPEGSEFYVDYNQRGHQVYRILAIDRSGKVRTVVEETPRTFVDWTAKTWRQWLDGSGELLWMSERSGWCHLWLVDARTGTVKNAVTGGDWVVRSVEHVDVERRQVWFLAGGIRPGQDPYLLHLCRVGFDGSGLVVLTEGDGTHKVEFSPDRRWFIDTWSRVDQPPVAELRSAEDGRLLTILERGDMSRLLATGWTVPERFAAKGRDGKTDIHGVVIRPSNLDPNRRYPVVEEIYAGPHGAFAPKEFGRATRQHAMAELGFVVVQLDGMGTSQRSKAFQDVSWKNLADSGFPDRRIWIRAAAETRPWMDLGRIGIYGGSAGGQSALRALLDHGDFYKVAVADCGCHDNRVDKIWWNEQWLGWPVDESYRRSSNVEDAGKLNGKLLLIVGEVDTNVDPASTLQVSAALVRADKDFELLVMPSTNHGAAETPYGSRRRMDFLVRHLHGREPRW